jgi:hypothetical protein
MKNELLLQANVIIVLLKGKVMLIIFCKWEQMKLYLHAKIQKVVSNKTPGNLKYLFELRAKLF